MQQLDTSLASFEIGSLAVGYKILDVVCREAGVKPLEASVLNQDRFLILAEGPESQLRVISAEAIRICETVSRDLLIDQEILARPAAALVPAFYSLGQTNLGDALIVVETETVSGLLAVAQSLLGWDGIEVLELKGTRGLGGKGLGFFSASRSNAAAAAESARVRLRDTIRSGRIETIVDAPPSFRQFFSLQP